MTVVKQVASIDAQATIPPDTGNKPKDKKVSQQSQENTGMISTNYNPSVLTTQRNLNLASFSLNTALERMSTGYKVNCAADDAAGMFVASNLNANIRGLKQAQKMHKTVSLS